MFLLFLSLPVLAGPPEPAVLVVRTSGVPAFEEAWNGLRTGFSPDALVSIDLKTANADAELDKAARRQPKLTIAVGVAALNAVIAHRFTDPILATMVLRSDVAPIFAASPVKKMAAVYLDVPLAEIAARLKVLFPEKDRLGLIRNPEREGPADPSPHAQAIGIETQDCISPDDLLKSLLAFRRSADFVVLRPDASLYNEATVRPLLIASVDNQLPVIGFSASFVRAGAALGMYPDFKDIGEQTCELARRYLSSGSGLVSESPRRLIIAVNQSVLRLLGLNYKTSPDYPVTTLK